MTHELEASYFITPHPKAPLFSEASNGKKVIEDLIQEASSPHPQVHVKEVREYFRQLGLVNLWFFLKFVSGHDGPYNLMNDTLHLSMCNFRQSLYCMKPGARAGIFIPRGMSKSTIFTHGPLPWELTRNGDLRFVIVNLVKEKSQEFMRMGKNTIEAGAMYGELYPECVPKKNADRWNMDEIVMPTRTRRFTEPSVAVRGITGSAEGGHFDVEVIDDPIGLESLDAQYQAGAGVAQAKKWLETNMYALLDSWRTSRILYINTRFAIDDPGQDLINDCESVHGFEDEEIIPIKGGAWAIYYRQAIERGKSIYEEKFPLESLLKMASDPEKRWTWITQYMNKPTQAGLAEFNQYEVKLARLEYSLEEKDFLLWRVGDSNFQEKTTAIRLSECDVLMSIDPAATDTGVTAKTSRTSIGVWARAWDDTYYRIWSRVGYFAIDTLIDNIFLGHSVFKGYIRGTIVESNAFQKVLKKLIDNEQVKRGVYVNAIPRASFTDKKARIRSALGVPLARGAIYVCEGAGEEFIEECRIFPMSDVRLDVLDESEKSISLLVKPMTEGEVLEKELDEEEREVDVIGAFGY